MTKPMTPQEARALIDVLNDYGQMDEEGIIVSVSRQAVHEAMEGLRAFAGMLERESRVKVDREAVKSAIMDYADALLTGGDPDPNEYTDRILSAIEGGE